MAERLLLLFSASEAATVLEDDPSPKSSVAEPAAPATAMASRGLASLLPQDLKGAVQEQERLTNVPGDRAVVGGEGVVVLPVAGAKRGLAGLEAPRTDVSTSETPSEEPQAMGVKPSEPVRSPAPADISMDELGCVFHCP